MRAGSIVQFLKDGSYGVVCQGTRFDLGLSPQNPLYVGNAITRMQIGQDFPVEVTEFTPEVCAKLFATVAKNTYAMFNHGSGMTGTDPEIFAFDEKDRVIPAWEWLPSQKQSKTAYWDGVQGEFTTEATACHNYQCDRVQTALRHVNNRLLEKFPKAKLATRDVVTLDKSLLMTADDKHVALGCSPSSNIYPDTKPIDILDYRDHPYRYSGCHIHQSVITDPVLMPSWFPQGTIAMIDKFAGLLLTALGRGMEDPRRRVAYGRAGEYRVPPPAPYVHDVLNKIKWVRLEYRTPGSFLLHHPALFNFGTDMVRSAMRIGLLMDGRLFNELPDVHEIINACDADAANKIIFKTHRGVFDTFFSSQALSHTYANDATKRIIQAGANASGKFGDDLAKNWRLAETWHTDNNNVGTRWSGITQL